MSDAAAASDAVAVSTALSLADKLGALRVRLGIRRYDYRVAPRLYRVGSPDGSSPVLVTANYKLTFDTVRANLVGLDVWLLVIDTKGINVWCAAGKQTFGTMELSRRIVETGLANVVDHRTIVLPQLGAPGVAAHDVRAFTGFRVKYGPVRASDIRAYLEAGMKATPEMRKVGFTLRDRFVLTGVELSFGFHPKALAAFAAVFVLGGVGAWGFSASALATRGVVGVIAGLLGLLGGAFVTPLLLPWLPFRSFAAKGALVGAVLGTLLAWATWDVVGALAAPAFGLAATVISSYVAMNFTGTSVFTSPSGVELEMRRALPLQIGGAALAVVGWLVSMVI